MLKPTDMFDRDREWSQLADFVENERAGATLGVVSGRRRQGKSFLLEAVCQQAGGFYFSAQEATETESLALVGTALTRHLDPVAPIAPTDWPTVIDILLRLGRERPVPVVIDEFPYLARVSPALPSMIQAAYAPAEPSGPNRVRGCSCAARRCRSWASCCLATHHCVAALRST